MLSNAFPVEVLVSSAGQGMIRAVDLFISAGYEMALPRFAGNVLAMGWPATL